MSAPRTTPPKILPPLRQGLVFSFSDYDLDGKPQWLIHDAGRNKFFIIGWVEYELLRRWDTISPDELLEEVNRTTTLHVDTADLENLIGFLKNNYLLKQSGYEIYKNATEQQLFKNDNFFHWLINYYLFFRIPLIHPDNFLVKTKVIGEILFSRITFFLMTILGIVALYQISVRWETFTHTFSSLVSWQGLFLYLCVFVFCKLFHELGHAYMCRSFGVPVPTLGVAFLVFWPVLYTDTTLSWSLNSKARMRIALAGMWIETYITIIAALIWANSDNLTLQSICYLVVAVNWVASLLINVSPFMRFDGYYVLADFLKMPNLQPRAFALTRWQLRRWLFGWDDSPPEHFSFKLHLILIIYSITTWLYRLVLYIGIAVLVYHFFFKAVGIILFLIELYYFILAPFVNEAKVWYYSRERFHWNANTIATACIASLAVLFFFLPVKTSVKMPATISYVHRFLIAPEEGTLANDPPPVGSRVTMNQPILVVESAALENDLKATYLEYQKSINELRRSSVDQKYSHQKDVLQSAIQKEQSKYDKLYSIRKTLTLSAPFNGVLIELAPDLKKGNTVMKNEWLGDIVQPNVIKIEAFVPQKDVYLVRKNLEGYFYPHNLSYQRVPVKVAYIEILNANELNCRLPQELKENKNPNLFVETPCYNSSELGGQIPTYLTDEGKYVPVNSVYRVLLTTPTPVTVPLVLRGTVVLKTKPSSYASRFFYQMKKILIEQSGF